MAAGAPDSTNPERFSDDEDDESAGPVEISSEADAPEADRLEQAEEVGPGEHRFEPSHAIDVAEADALDQAAEVPLDEDEVR